MYQLFQDSMDICRHFHKPDLFLTMTANPNWPVIQEALLEYDGVDDDPDCILLHCQPATPAVLWQNYREKICDDLQHRLITHHQIPDPTDDQVYDYGLYLLNHILLKSGKCLSDFDPMPLPEAEWHDHLWDNHLLQEQSDYDIYNLLIDVHEN
jgi:hypothetical protein